VTIWLDNQLPPALAAWMRAALALDCTPVRELNLQRVSDHEIFMSAREARAIVMTKDGDFVELLERHGPPPQVILVTCGNTSNTQLRRLVSVAWPVLRPMLERGEALVELGDQLDQPA
jgi:predicted nuclease of predicted toxin-antitoxin system